MRILVVEDEPKMRSLLQRALAEEGYAVDTAADGPQALGLAAAVSFDAAVLDVMVPGLDGFEVCARLRRSGTWAPVLMLTARDAVADRVRGLDGGADDYLTKPFALDELLARLRALIRRGPVPRPQVLQAGDLRLDPATRTAIRGAAEITVTGKEYALLEALLRRPGVVLTREMLTGHCWDLAASPYSNVVDAHIKSLRGKIDRPFGAQAIETVRLAATLNTMLHRLQTALDRERRFVADAGHELRTPLSLLHTEVELALRHPRDAAALHDALASAHEEALRLVRLTEDLLLLARTDPPGRRGGAGQGVGAGTRLAPLLHRIAARPGNGSHGTRITVTCPDQLTVPVAEGHLERAVTNMAHNALRHGAAPVEITAALRVGQAEIRVRDRGPGFPPAFLPSAFDRFTRADDARSGPGTGLGLAITAAIARTSGGSHGAANRPGGGADVWISLPATTSHAAGVNGQHSTVPGGPYPAHP